MKRITTLLVFAFMSNFLFGQNFMSQMAPPLSPDASKREEEQAEKERFIIEPSWIANAVELAGKRYFKVEPRTIYRLDSISANGTNKFAKTQIARFDSQLSDLVVLGKRLYFIEQDANCVLFGYDGNEISALSTLGKYDCHLTSFTGDDKKLIITLQCSDKVEIIEKSKASLEPK